ncbi:MAG: hypothetical protein M1833_007350 [Piccolia ochrophora]|nr:MAG: hypothetical protein M1833_007350 [Piccolia ochrophora]
MSGDIKLTNDALGDPLSTKSKVLETGASITQDLSPIKQVCAHLNAFHVYASDPGRGVEANHYCSHLNEGPNARLIGVEYMITPRVYETLSGEERKLWHSHVFEVKSGMLIMPTPPGVPQTVWETAETSEMRDVIPLYGKTYHLWQVDRGDKVPLGAPELMMSFTAPSQLDFEEVVGERDQRYGVNHKHKAELRRDIVEPDTHQDADSMWTSSTSAGKKSEQAGVDAGGVNILKGR